MFDFHTHILPGMDDGSNSIQESEQMIQRSFNQGVELLVATPHYYPWQEKTDAFLERRENSLRSLKVPSDQFRVGAEVAYFDGIVESEDLEKLKIEDTNLLLVKMPMVPWTTDTLAILHEVENNRKLKVVLAHIDRYIKTQKGTNNIDYVCENFLTQVNADYFTNRWTQHKAIKMIKDDTIDFIGSDCHNMTSQPPNVCEAYQTMCDKLGTSSVKTFLEKQIKYLW